MLIAGLTGQVGRPSPRPWRPGARCGVAITSADPLHQLEQAGIDRIIFRAWRTSREAIEGTQRFADDVLHKL